MAGDYSRLTFDPRRNHAGALKQQGRVGLDSDWNEDLAIHERRERTETLDVLGPCTVPASTADAFVVTPTALGDFSIGVGRLYLDGFQVENHGLPPLVYDPVLEGSPGSNPLLYSNQPYLPAPLPPALAAAPGTTDLVYLAVWRREITAVEEPALLEIALGGADTATRWQTAWQVGVLEDVGSLDCAGPLAAWDNLIAPSPGRLTTAAVAPPASDDPCTIAPGGGYRGLENRLYRVEIHQGGALGTARFKWSRDNASVAARVEAINPAGDVLTVQSLGRDAVLRFRPGDWVEVLDDHRELSGQPGHVTRVVTVNEAQRQLTLNPPVPGGFNLNPGDPARHTRVRRWDQSQGVDAQGLLTTGAGPLAIEDGIQVSFSGASFHDGDYWVFAARTADGSVEVLSQAPPRGVLHHYCRLALIHWGNDLASTGVTDCRVHWPPGEGCCTVVVDPGESIQAALDSLPAEGGCVCLKTGVHVIDAPIRVEGSNVVLKGESPGTVVLRRNGIALLRVASPQGAVLERVQVQGIRFQLEADPNTTPFDDFALVQWDRIVDGVFQDCQVAMNPLPVELIGVFITRSADVRVAGSVIDGLLYGLWVRADSARMTVADNRLTAPVLPISPAFTGPFGFIGVWLEEASGASSVKRNRVFGFQTGIVVEGRSLGARIVRNHVQRGGFVDQTMVDDRAYAIEAAPIHCLVRDNTMNLASPLHGGVRAAGSRVRVLDNRVESTIAGDGNGWPLGIFLGPVSNGSPPVGGVIQGNRLRGGQDGILVEGAVGTRVAENSIEPFGALVARVGITLEAVAAARVEDNRITGAADGLLLNQGRQNLVSRCTITNGQRGIGAVGETGLQVLDSTVEVMGSFGLAGNQLLETARVSRCRFLNCGYDGNLGPIGMAVAVGFSLAEVDVTGCEILDTGLPPQGAVTTTAAVGIWMPLVLACRVQGNLIGFRDLANLDPTREDRAVLLVGLLSYVFGNQVLAFGSALVLDNKLLGVGLSALAELQRVDFGNISLRFEKVIFSNNHCVHLTRDADDNRATVRLWGRHLIVMGNHLKAGEGFFSMDFNGLNQVSLLGNVTTGGFLQLGGSVPTPAASFNLQI